MIRDAIAQDIADGTMAPGDRLPTEPALAERFGAGRHSVRRAIEALSKEGKLSVEQGRGTFVEEPKLLTYTIGKRTRLRANLLPQGYDVTGDLLGAERITAPDRVRRALHLDPGAVVTESRRITRADEVPIAFGAAYHDVVRFPDFPERRDILGSTTEAYRSYGIQDYVRGETTFHSRIAKPEEAQTLRQHRDLPVVVVRAVDTLLDGTPISYSQVIWSATRVKFTVSGGSDG